MRPKNKISLKQRHTLGNLAVYYNNYDYFYNNSNYFTHLMIFKPTNISSFVSIYTHFIFGKIHHKKKTKSFMYPSNYYSSLACLVMKIFLLFSHHIRLFFSCFTLIFWHGLCFVMFHFYNILIRKYEANVVFFITCEKERHKNNILTGKIA